ncbi:MAG TPA: PEP-utilizing enzyme, partial [Ilumatobacteraceae bacterium]
LVVSHLDPRLAPVIPRLGGLVAETGNPLSHLAILAREHGVPIVVGYAAATEQFHTGDVVSVDGHTGTVTVVEAAPGADVVELPILHNLDKHLDKHLDENTSHNGTGLHADVPNFISGVAS